MVTTDGRPRKARKGCADRLVVAFDDERAVANAGVLLVGSLARRLGIARLVDEAVRLGPRPGAANAGAKVMTLVGAMALGADSIDDCQIVRVGRTEEALGQRAAAPSTIGTFLRGFSFGHVRQLDRVLDQAIGRAWAAGAGPRGRLVVDIDSFVGEVHGYAKQGAAFGHTRQRGYHPLVATRADTGEVLHIRLRTGSANSARGAGRFVDELLGRIGRAGAPAERLLRADSGFWSNALFARLERAGWRYSIGVRMQQNVRRAIAAIPESAWMTLADYPPSGQAQIAETRLGARRLVVRRVRLLADQQQLVPDWRHFAFVTNRDEPLGLVEAEHREHAACELAIRDLKAQALRHFPSGRFFANAAWAVIGALAHNLVRWVGVIGLPGRRLAGPDTMRRRLLALPGRLTRSAGQDILHLPARWPWRAAFCEALSRIRALAPA